MSCSLIAALLVLLPPSDPSTDLYVSVPDVDEVRRWDPDTGTLLPFAAGMQVPFYGEWGTDGHLYMPDSTFRSVWKIAPDGSTQLLSAGGLLLNPITVAFAPDGDLMVSDGLNHWLVRIDPDTGAQTLEVDNSSGLFNGPGGIGYDLDGNLFVGNVFGNSVLKVDDTGQVSQLFLDTALLVRPAGVQADGSGNVFVVGYWSDNVVRIRADTGAAEVWCDSPLLARPNDLKLSHDGALLAVSETGSSVVRIDAIGQASVVAQNSSHGIWTGVSIPADHPRCQGRMTPYGDGTAGSGGFVPEYRGIYSPCVGREMGLELVNGLGGASAFVIFSLQPGNLSLWGGTVHVGLVQPFSFFAVALGGAAPGEGSFRLSATLPENPALVGLSLYEQVLVLDPQAPRGFAMSNGLQIQFAN